MTPTDDVMGVSARGSPTVCRLTLGLALKGLRSRKGLTAEQVYERTRIGTTKLSRLETGDRGADEEDVNELCKLYQVDDRRRERLVEYAGKGKERAWWQTLDMPYSEYVGLEQGAVAIRDYGLGVIPGLLQTRDYANAAVRAGVYDQLTPAEIKQRVDWRMRRQRLLEEETAPRFEAVMDESVLYRVVGDEAIMRAQLKRLLDLFELSNVVLRIVPFRAGAPRAANSKFIIVTFELPDIAELGFDVAFRDVVFIEGLAKDQYLYASKEVMTYNRAFDALIEQALEPEATYKFINETAERRVPRFAAPRLPRPRQPA